MYETSVPKDKCRKPTSVTVQIVLVMFYTTIQANSMYSAVLVQGWGEIVLLSGKNWKHTSTLFHIP